MGSLRPHYALNQDDRLLSFNEAVRYLRDNGEPERCYCPGCNREVHISLQTGSFIHNTSRPCKPESYIHNLGVINLLQRFNSDDKSLRIGIKRKVLCRDSKTCPFYSGTYSCWGEEVKRYDLKKLYTRCDYPSGGLDFTVDLVLSDDEGKKPPLYILIRTDYLVPLTLPPDVLLVEIAVRTEEAAERLRNEDIIEGGERVHCLFYGPWKRKGGLSYGPLCEREKRLRTL